MTAKMQPEVGDEGGRKYISHPPSKGGGTVMSHVFRTASKCRYTSQMHPGGLGSPASL